MNRETQLNALLRMYDENEDAMCEALAKDLHKSRQESIINEVEFLRNEVRHLLINLRSYAEPEYVSVKANMIIESVPLGIKCGQFLSAREIIC